MPGIDSYTKLCLHFEQNWADSSGNGHTAANYGNASVAGGGRFGYGASFDGASDAAYCDGSADFAFGTGDFTVDFWMYSFVRPASFAMLYDMRPNATNGPYFGLLFNPGGDLTIFVNGSGQLNSSVVPNQEWHHIAVSRASGTTRMFVDGVLSGSYADSTNYATSASRPVIAASGESFPNYSYNGALDELRVSVGIARWTSNFTPPTAPYDTLPPGPSPGTDAGVGTNVATLVVTGLVATETRTGTDVGSVAVPVPDADTGAGTESAVLLSRISNVDTGIGSDLSTPAAALLATEIGTETDAATAAVPVMAADAGAAIETTALLGRLVLVDTGSGADSGVLPEMLLVIGTRAIVLVQAYDDWDCHLRWLDPVGSDVISLDPVSSAVSPLDPVISAGQELDPTSSGDGWLDPLISDEQNLVLTPSSCR